MRLERALAWLIFGLFFAAAAAEVERQTLNDGNLILEDIPEVSDLLAEQLNRYQNVRSASFAGWAPQDGGLFVTTRFADVSQLHRVEMPGGARRQLTFADEPVGGVAPQPGGTLVAFTMDAGGNEFDQIFLFDPATADYRMLTDGESRNGVVEWSHDGQRIAFQSTRRNGRSNDIWLMPAAAPGEAEIILESPDGSWWGADAFSPDDRRLLVQQYVSVNDSRVHIVDLGSGARKMVAGDPENPSANLGLDFDANGEGFFYLSDSTGEFTKLMHQSLSDGTVTMVTEDIPWNVTGLAISDGGQRAAFTVNENGFNALYLLDPESLEYRKVAGVPTGLIGLGEFDHDGRRLALTLNSAQTPSDTYVLTLGEGVLDAGSLVRWTFSEVGGLDTDRFVQPRLIEYPTFDQSEGQPRRIPAFVYQPEGSGPFPVIISIHGGPESQFRPAFRSTYQYWVNGLGAAVVAPNVRGSAGYGKTYLKLDNGMKREDSVRDIGALLDWIAAQPEFDSQRVAVFGGSYGGYMVLASAVHYSDRLKAAVDVVGISNFVTFLENTQDYRRDLRRVEYGDERDPEMRAFLQRISPLNNVDRIRIPLLVIQGQNDPRVPVTESEQMVQALRGGGQTVWYMNALNEGHGYARKENRDVYIQAVALFFKEHLLR